MVSPVRLVGCTETASAEIPVQPAIPYSVFCSIALRIQLRPVRESAVAQGFDQAQPRQLGRRCAMVLASLTQETTVMLHENDIEDLLRVSRTPTIVMASGDRYECTHVIVVDKGLKVTGTVLDTRGDEQRNVTALLSYAQIAEIIVGPAAGAGVVIQD